MKFRGAVGFGFNEERESKDGVWELKIVKKTYTGDVLKNFYRNQSTEHQNDDISIDNQISIVADLYAYEHFGLIKYVEWMGTLWRVSSVDVQRPRLILNIGGVYNGPED